jgi:hypothetical protein
MDDRNFNVLSEFEVKMLKQSWSDLNFSNIITEEPDRSNITLVAEGDSWFDYPVGVDIIDFLRIYYKYKTVNLSHYGDKLLKIIYGNEKNNKEKNLDFINETLIKSKSKTLLFSGGGNDIAGEALEVFLHYFQSDMQPKDVVNYSTLVMFLEELKTGLVYLINNIDAKILMHGYGYPVPNGNPVLRLFGAIPLVGPWLQPAFRNRGIEDSNLTLRIEIMKIIIDEFNNILIKLQSEHPEKFYFIECRNIIDPFDWINELHVNNNCYKKIADKFFKKLKELNIA